MTLPPVLQSFRIGVRALRAVWPESVEARQCILPSTSFNWHRDGTARTAVAADGAGVEPLARWAAWCEELGIQPVLLLAPGDAPCDEEGVLDLQDAGVELIDLGLEAPDVAGRQHASEPTLRERLELPDAFVVAASFAASLGHRPDLWRLCGDPGFWVVYGGALDAWGAARAVDAAERLRDLAATALGTAELPRYWSVPADRSRVVRDEALLASFAQPHQHQRLGALAISVDLPFLRDECMVADGSIHHRGRMPGLTIDFDAALLPAPQSMRQALSWLRDALTASRMSPAGGMAQGQGTRSVLADVRHVGDPAVADDFARKDCIGRLLEGPRPGELTLELFDVPVERPSRLVAQLDFLTWPGATPPLVLRTELHPGQGSLDGLLERVVLRVEPGWIHAWDRADTPPTLTLDLGDRILRCVLVPQQLDGAP